MTKPTPCAVIPSNAVVRPWGWYNVIDAGDGFQVKRIMVNPGGSLSLQSHAKRAEHWVVVTGTATITVGERVAHYTSNRHVYIPIGSKHRLQNHTNEMVQLIEVQSGSYLGEDDIVRYEDIYNRATLPSRV
jgi:mannose-1-phosphate guanylyltransferase / mannose-6-phosphate isomerase